SHWKARRAWHQGDGECGRQAGAKPVHAREFPKKGRRPRARRDHAGLRRGAARIVMPIAQVHKVPVPHGRRIFLCVFGQNDGLSSGAEMCSDDDGLHDRCRRCSWFKDCCFGSV
ncbi:MAG: hypothetical protein ACOVJ6_06895, partial [Pirellulales bacterium]